MTKPFCVSQSLRPLGSVAWSCTVSYGPTFCCFVTVTPSFPPDDPDGTPAAKPPPWQSEGIGGQPAGGLIVVVVSSSIESKRTSALRPTVTVPWIGSTQANDVG